MAKDKVAPILMVSVFGAVLGMFQFGYNTGVLNTPQKTIERWISKTGINNVNLGLSLMVGAFAAGGMLGALLGPRVGSLGPKRGLMINNIFGLLAATFMVLSQAYLSLYGFVIGRVMIGMYCALSMGLVPVYLTEISPTNLRGAIGTLNQLAVTIGLLLSQVLGQSYILGTESLWGYLFVIVYIPAIIQTVLLSLCPESPRYLYINQKDIVEAKSSLNRLRTSSEEVQCDLDQMALEEESSKDDIQKYGKIESFLDLVKQQDIRLPLLLGLIMQMSQQLSGINVVLNYSTSIFRTAGLDDFWAAQATMSIGLVMIIMTLITIPLMDRLGRRTLHLFGLGGMFFCSISLTITLSVALKLSWVNIFSIIGVILFVVFFALGPGSIPFIIMTELFTQGARPKAVCVCVFFNWFTNLLVTFSFPLIEPYLGTYIFVPYVLLLGGFWTFFFIKLPETKNRTFDEISSLFKSSSASNYSSFTMSRLSQ